MGFNKEDKISYNELAKSLRDLLDDIGIKADISKNLDEINDSLNDIEKKIQQIKSNDDIKNMIWSDLNSQQGLTGQVLKIDNDNKKFYTHDEILFKRVVHNDTQLQEEFKRIPTLMTEIFNTWYRYAHFNAWACHLLDNTNWKDAAIPEGQNLNNFQYTVYTDKTKDGWQYIKQTNQIYGGYDYMPCTGFISPTADKLSYYIETMVDVGWDDDNLMIVIGYLRDTNGIEHTLSVVRGDGCSGYGSYPSDYPNFPGYVDTKFWWGIIYDMGNATQKFIVDWNNITGPNYNHSGDYNITYLKITRDINKFTCSTTGWSHDGSNKTYDPKDTFTFQCPDTKPDDWSQEMYNNIKEMTTKPNHIGFGARSGQPKFTIVDQSGIFDDTDIYALHTNKQYYFNYYTNKWSEKQNLQDNPQFNKGEIFLYNKTSYNFYFWYKPFTWQKIWLNSFWVDVTIIQSEGQTIIVHIEDKEYTQSFKAKYDTEFTVTVKNKNNDYIEGVPSIDKGIFRTPITITATPVKFKKYECNFTIAYFKGVDPTGGFEQEDAQFHYYGYNDWSRGTDPGITEKGGTLEYVYPYGNENFADGFCDGIVCREELNGSYHPFIFFGNEGKEMVEGEKFNELRITFPDDTIFTYRNIGLAAEADFWNNSDYSNTIYEKFKSSIGVKANFKLF